MMGGRDGLFSLPYRYLLSHGARLRTKQARMGCFLRTSSRVSLGMVFMRPRVLGPQCLQQHFVFGLSRTVVYSSVLMRPFCYGMRSHPQWLSLCPLLSALEYFCLTCYPPHGLLVVHIIPILLLYWPLVDSASVVLWERCV